LHRGEPAARPRDLILALGGTKYLFSDPGVLSSDVRFPPFMLYPIAEIFGDGFAGAGSMCGGYIWDAILKPYAATPFRTFKVDGGPLPVGSTVATVRVVDPQISVCVH
jgi:hypothetical protein